MWFDGSTLQAYVAEAYFIQPKTGGSAFGVPTFGLSHMLQRLFVRNRKAKMTNNT